MQFDTKQLYWINPPEKFKINSTHISFETLPHTDFWQNTYYEFKHDNGHALQLKTKELYFSFNVKVSFDTKKRFDQAGIIVYLDSNRWLKASAEYQDEHTQQLGSVVTNHGYSDWTTMNINGHIKHIWYRLSRRKSDFRIEYSLDGNRYIQMRIAHLDLKEEAIVFGFYACSPEDSTFTAQFSEFKLTDCIWETHK